LSTATKRAKTGAISYIIPLEVTVAVVRLDDKVVGKIILYHANDKRHWYVYVPAGYGAGRRNELPTYGSIEACKAAIEGS
jgi:hypothetical protein